MSNSTSSVPTNSKLPKTTVKPPVAAAIIIVFIALIGYFGYRWMDDDRRVPTDVQINAAKFFLEKPVREKLEAEGVAKPEIESRVRQMWDRGELKLPPGKPGVDWAGTPNGIVTIPKGPGGAP